MAGYVENLPLTEKEIDEAEEYLCEQLLPLGDRKTARPLDEVFKEVIAKYAKFPCDID